MINAGLEKRELNALPGVPSRIFLFQTFKGRKAQSGSQTVVAILFFFAHKVWFVIEQPLGFKDGFYIKPGTNLELSIAEFWVKSVGLEFAEYLLNAKRNRVCGKAPTGFMKPSMGPSTGEKPFRQ